MASSVVVESLRDSHDVEVVDLGRSSQHDGTISVRRLIEVTKALRRIWREQRTADAIYLTIAESLAGNLKDLAIYGLCARRLSRTYLHLHGGTIGVALFKRHPTIRRMNAAFIRRMAGVIVSGPSHIDIFADMIDPRRVHVIPNFAQDFLFVTPEQIANKFESTGPLRVLYVSAMTPLKGYEKLLEAYCGLDPAIRGDISLHFAGRFDSAVAQEQFSQRIAGIAGVRYHGVIDEDEKRRLFSEAHVFCLPTAMLEGQPISILEAYASGCAVITTGQPGIRDVFENGRNGFEVSINDIASIRQALTTAARDRQTLRGIASSNLLLAETRYRTQAFAAAVRRLLEA